MTDRERQVRWLPLRNRLGEVVASTMVDSEDYDRVAGYRWHLGRGYVTRSERVGPGKYVSFRLHREIVGAADSALYVDHINGDKLDNRKANLRIVTPQQSAQNVRARGGTSRFRGVSMNPDGTWRATVRIAKVDHYLGRFSTEEEAAGAASAYRRAHMPFAVARDEAVACA